MKQIRNYDTRSNYLVSMSDNKLTFRPNYTKPKKRYQTNGCWQSPIDYYSTKLEKFRPGKQEAAALCPFHAEKNPSFSVNLMNGKFICFACGVGGGMLTFQMMCFKQSRQEAIAELCRGC